MCGIVGYFSPQRNRTDLNNLYEATSLISHRGPDDEGYAVFNLNDHIERHFCGPDSPDVIKARTPLITEAQSYCHHLAFGFRRFSIVDLSEKGHQPFWSRNKNICLIFNGEIYNYVEIRNELQKQGYQFGTRCDTEVLLIGYQAWGMEVLKYCNGPIALVLYDKQKNKLFMARDRIGKSPLYYTIHQDTLYWASEIKSILHMAGHTSFGINEQVVYDYLNDGHRDLDNTTFWDGIFTLPSASWTSIDLDCPPSFQEVTNNLTAYWTFPQNRLAPSDAPFSEAMTHFREIFLDAVRIRARADAKIAFSLSGGIDSSTIVAAAANMLSKPFRTYSIMFEGEEQDEEPLARMVYHKYPQMVDYHTYTPDNMDFWEVANDYIWLQEEPFHFPNAELFQAYFRKARAQDYKVMIVGAGGDELLAGYKDYFFPLLTALRQEKRYLPMLSNLFFNTTLWSGYCLRKRLKILMALLTNQIDKSCAEIPVSFFNPSGFPWANMYLKSSVIQHQNRLHRSGIPSEFHGKTIGYMSNWLMNYWLRNGNRSHFGVPMETRSPFLDYRLIDFIFTLPPEYLVNYGWTKYLLRKSFNQWLPRKVIWNRKKQGLPFNTHSWFNHAKPIVENHLKSVYNNPYVDTDSVLENYDELLQRQPAALWRVINFCLWWKRVILQESL